VVKIQPSIHSTGPATPGQSGMYPGTNMKKIGIGQREDAQIDPVAPRIISDIQCQSDDNGRHTKKQQVPSILEDAALRHSWLEGNTHVVDRICRL
jgi:hypothetical protein